MGDESRHYSTECVSFPPDIVTFKSKKPGYESKKVLRIMCDPVFLFGFSVWNET
jgi:hypothetical protein